MGGANRPSREDHLIAGMDGLFASSVQDQKTGNLMLSAMPGFLRKTALINGLCGNGLKI
jgi:hypothetical protein